MDQATTIQPNEFKWRVMETAPQDGKFDVWAKRWVAKGDFFEYRRFTDCFWRSRYLANCEKGWSPTHWCPILPPPLGYDQ